eukprot:TRINITY_DN12328_c0_g1_i7.p1 TRINITY_DN12328_c0_g1~~TRINITY_DN12328_c0_g1_i7.p1  ORF type:complete len:104 (+),score=11.78 TRINITY_DN12328_c0_g1_i7:32-343(+)
MCTLMPSLMMSSGFTCGASMTSVSTVCSFCDFSVEGDDVDKDGAVEFSAMSLILFPFHKKVCVLTFIIVHFLIRKPLTSKNNMSNIHMDHITPDFVFRMAHLE